MLFNFAWLYNFALKDYINISQQEVFGILFPALYVGDILPDAGDCSNRISGKLPLTRPMIQNFKEDTPKIECRIENLQLSDIDEICKRIFFMLIDEEFSLEGKKKYDLISKYKRITFSADRESQNIDSRLSFIAESLKTAVNQSSAKIQKNNQEWVLCQDKELHNYKAKYVNADLKRLDEANTENNIGYERTLSVDRLYPKVFISYAWEDEEHRQWVKEFANCLLEDGLDATLDQYDLSLGDRLPEFMEKSISEADFVLIICTPTYKTKSDNRQGGVGYEGHIISGELVSIRNERKFIPIIRKGDLSQSIPTILSGKLGIDLRDSKEFDNNLKILLNTLHGIKEKPPIKLIDHNRRLEYSVDIVFCIDGTESMNTLKTIKGQAVHLYQDTRYYFEKMAKPIEQIRARIILFRDFLSDGNHALMETDFFHLPEETSDFDRILNNIEVCGGGDGEEDGLEALGLAIQSKWNRQGMRNRHIIVLWTDAPPHELGFGSKGVNYPKDMAGSFDELTKWWMDEDIISQTGKRLLLFTPDKSWWKKIRCEWNRVICYEVEEHASIKEMNYDDIISLIANSV